MEDSKDSLETLIKEFNTREKSVVALFGGDGTLVGEWRKHRARKGGKAIIFFVEKISQYWDLNHYLSFSHPLHLLLPMIISVKYTIRWNR